jgi:hypothetical protein
VPPSKDIRTFFSSSFRSNNTNATPADVSGTERSHLSRQSLG